MRRWERHKVILSTLTRDPQRIGTLWQTLVDRQEYFLTFHSFRRDCYELAISEKVGIEIVVGKKQYHGIGRGAVVWLK